MTVRSESPQFGVACCTIAIDLPSGDQDRGDAGELGGAPFGRLQVPALRRRAAPPLADTSQTCEGMAAPAARKSLSPTSNASLCRSSSFLLGFSSAVAYAICEPSGLHANCSTSRGALVIR